MSIGPRRAGIAAAVALLLAAQTPPPPEPSCTHVDGPHRGLAYEVHIVFFDRDSAAITRSAAATLAQAAETYRPLAHCLLTVAAHADGAGPSAYNLRLSLRRATAVVARLRRLGVHAPAVIEAFGETRPIVETADGAQEAQNRRAEIIIGPRRGR